MLWVKVCLIERGVRLRAHFAARCLRDPKKVQEFWNSISVKAFSDVRHD